MNICLLIAGILCLLLGLSHSLLGEGLIFAKIMAARKNITSSGIYEFEEGHIKIIRATWHLTSLFGWCLGAILIKVAYPNHIVSNTFILFVSASVALTMFFSAYLVCLSTKGRHLGWVILFITGVLALVASLK